LTDGCHELYLSVGRDGRTDGANKERTVTVVIVAIASVAITLYTMSLLLRA
jgi:hypothetical protein